MAGVKPLLETIGALLPKGIKAWHASPHDFDKVDLSKIGTGQGAASYGPGFYAAESPAVSGRGGEYWKEFLSHPDIPDLERTAAEYLAAAKFDHGAALAEVRRDAAAALKDPRFASPGARRSNAEEFDQISRLLESGKPIGPRVYELNLKADPRSFLQWDEPLSQQPNITKKVPQLLDAARAEASNRALSATTRPRRDELYDMIKNPEQATGSLAMQSWNRVPGNLLSGAGEDRGVAAMNALRDAGIPGIRYADAQSRSLVTSEAATRNRLSELEGQIAELRAKGDNLRASELDRDRSVLERTLAFPRTYNYVVNNPDIIEIMRKLAIPGMLTGGAASVYQPQGQQ